MAFSIMFRPPGYGRFIFDMGFPKPFKMFKLLNSQNVIGFFENLLLSLEKHVLVFKKVMEKKTSKCLSCSIHEM